MICTAYSMEQSCSWEANRFAASQEIPRILRNPKAHYLIHKCPHLSISWASSIQARPPHPTSWISILILSSHLRRGLPSGYDLYCWPNAIRVTKSRRMRWAGHVARIGERRGSYRVSVGDLRERDHLEDLGAEWVFRKYGRGREFNWFDSGQGQVAWCCAHGNESRVP
jgi:hypothetical protein